MVIQDVNDPASNANEVIDNAARAIGRSAQRRAVFIAIHHGKKTVKTVADVAKATRLTAKQVLDAAKPLEKKQVIQQVKSNGQTAYRKSPFLQAHKRTVLQLAGNPKRLATYPTKRNTGWVSRRIVGQVASGAQIKRITIDDLPAFKRVRRMQPSENRLPPDLSEKDFKDGIQRILGEPGKFQDWGGEKHDLFTTRLVVDGARRAAALAFKGPGLRTTLRPKNMGTNGDQALRLFDSSADVFLVQHWREIHESVLDLVQRLALARALQTTQKVWFGTIDGKDSRRVYEAYPEAFRTPRRSRARTKKRRGSQAKG